MLTRESDLEPDGGSAKFASAYAGLAFSGLVPTIPIGKRLVRLGLVNHACGQMDQLAQ